MTPTGPVPLSLAHVEDSEVCGPSRHSPAIQPIGNVLRESCEDHKKVPAADVLPGLCARLSRLEVGDKIAVVGGTVLGQ